MFCSFGLQKVVGLRQKKGEFSEGIKALYRNGIEREYDPGVLTVRSHDIFSQTTVRQFKSRNAVSKLMLVSYPYILFLLRVTVSDAKSSVPGEETSRKCPTDSCSDDEVQCSVTEDKDRDFELPGMRTKRRRDDDEHSVINLIPDDSKRPQKDLGSINLVTASHASAVVSPQTE